jgi:hypothetical protein
MAASNMILPPLAVMPLFSHTCKNTFCISVVVVVVVTKCEYDDDQQATTLTKGPVSSSKPQDGTGQVSGWTRRRWSHTGCERPRTPSRTTRRTTPRDDQTWSEDHVWHAGRPRERERERLPTKGSSPRDDGEDAGRLRRRRERRDNSEDYHCA